MPAENASVVVADKTLISWLMSLSQGSQHMPKPHLHQPMVLIPRFWDLAGDYYLCLTISYLQMRFFKHPFLLTIGIVLFALNSNAQISRLDSFPGNSAFTTYADSGYVYWFRSNYSEHSSYFEAIHKKSQVKSSLFQTTGEYTQAAFVRQYLIYFTKSQSGSTAPKIYDLHCYDLKRRMEVLYVPKISTLGSNVPYNYQFGFYVSDDNFLYVAMEQNNTVFGAGKYNLSNGNLAKKIPLTCKLFQIFPISDKLLFVQNTDSNIHFVTRDTSLNPIRDSIWQTRFGLQNTLSVWYQTKETLLFNLCRDSASSGGGAVYCIPALVRFGASDGISQLIENKTVNSVVAKGANSTILQSGTGYQIYQNGTLIKVNQSTDHTGNANEIRFVKNTPYFRHFNPIVGWEYGYLKEDGSLRLYGDLDSGKINNWTGQFMVPDFVNNGILYAFLESKNLGYGLALFDTDKGMKRFYRIGNRLQKNSFIDLQFLDSGILIFGFSDANTTNLVILNFHIQEADTTLRPQLFSHQQQANISDTWFREFNSISPSGTVNFSTIYSSGQNGLYLDEAHNSTILFSKNGATRNFTMTRGDSNYFSGIGCNYLFHYNRFGTLIWSASFGDYARSPVHSACDKAHGIVWIGAPTNGEFFYRDSLLHAGISGLLILKIDIATGRLLWSGIMNPGQNAWAVEVDCLATDDEGSVYVACLSHSFTTVIGNTTIRTDLSPSNILFKLREDGNFEWAKSIITPWTDEYGLTRVMEYDPKSRALIAIQSQGYKNTWSSCGYKTWNYFHQFLDKNGTILSTGNITSSDLGGITSGAFNNYSQFVTQGYYRGTMHLGRQDFTTAYENGCSRNESFKYFLSRDRSTPQMVSVTKRNPAFSFEATFSHGYLYSLFVDEKNRLFLSKQNQLGKTVALLDLRQKMDFWEYYTPVSFDINDSFIVLSYSYYRNDSLFITHNSGLSDIAEIVNGILKIRNAGWVEIPGSEPSTSSGDFSVVPVPATDFVMVTIAPESETFTHYKLFDVAGNKVMERSIPDGTNQFEITTGQLPGGTYLLQLYGPGVSKTKKIVVL